MEELENTIASAKKAENDKDWNLAAELYGKLYDLDASNPDWPYRRGLSLERAKRYQESVSSYLQALSMKQKHEWWHRVGVSAECNKDHKLAKEAYSKSLGLKGGNQNVAYELLEHSVSAFTARYRTLEYLQQKLPVIKDRTEKRSCRQSSDIKIFTYWDSGFDRAPAVVRACYREMIRIHGKENVVALDSENWRFYVNIPKHITDKSPANKAHFSDVLRAALLSEYGGIWADATCLFSRNVINEFDDLSRSGFFSYHYTTARISSWFLCSSGDNYIAKMLFESMNEYWKDHDTLQHYFLFHHMLEVLYLIDNKFRDCWDASTKASSREPHIIQKYMMTPYKKKEFDKAYNNASVHKLTYKFNMEDLKNNSIISHIVRGDF